MKLALQFAAAVVICACSVWMAHHLAPQPPPPVPSDDGCSFRYSMSIRHRCI